MKESWQEEVYAEITRLRALVEDSRRALQEITEFSSGWTHGQEGMCLLRIDTLARAQIAALHAKLTAEAKPEVHEDWCQSVQPIHQDGPCNCLSSQGAPNSPVIPDSSPQAPAPAEECPTCRGKQFALQQTCSNPFHLPASAECACRKALRKLFNSCSTTHPDWGADIREPDGNDMSQACAALATSCPCETLREERDTARKGMDDLEAECEHHATDRATLHRWFPAMFGEVMDGRDFAVKCEMASREITKLRADLTAANERAEKAEAEAQNMRTRLNEALDVESSRLTAAHKDTDKLRSERDAARKELAEAVEALRVAMPPFGTHHSLENSKICAWIETRRAIVARHGGEHAE